jgi:hypothetical protein
MEGLAAYGSDDEDAPQAAPAAPGATEPAKEKKKKKKAGSTARRACAPLRARTWALG